MSAPGRRCVGVVMQEGKGGKEQNVSGRGVAGTWHPEQECDIQGLPGSRGKSAVIGIR